MNRELKMLFSGDPLLFFLMISCPGARHRSQDEKQRCEIQYDMSRVKACLLLNEMQNGETVCTFSTLNVLSGFGIKVYHQSN